MAVEIGALRALLSLDSTAFRRGAERAEASMSAMQRRMSRMGRSMGEFGRTMSMRVTAPVVGGFGLMSRNSLRTAEDITRFAQLSNTGTTEFQRFAAGARAAGLEHDKVADILKDVNDRVGDFIQTGGGPMADFFENIAPKVGVTADQFARLSGPDGLRLYVSSLEAAGLSQQEMTFYLEAMASDATALIPLLANNGEEMDRLADRAQSLGKIMDEQTIASLNDARQSLRDLRDAGAGFSNRVMAAMAPAIERLAELIEGLSTWFSKLSPEVQKFIAVGASVAAVIGPAAVALGLMATAVAAISAPVALAAAAIAGLAAGAGLLHSKWDGISTWWSGLWDGIGERTRAADAQAATDLQSLSGRISQLASSVAGYFSELGQDIAQGIRSGISEAVAAITELGEEIVDYVRGLPARLVESGRNIAQGLADGIRGRASSAIAAARGMAQSAINTVRENFDENSPSRVFKKIGEFVSEGLQIGISGGAPAAIDAARGMAESVTDAASTASEKIANFSSGFASAIGPVIKGTQSIGSAFRAMAQKVSNSLIDTGLNSLGDILGGAIFGGGGKGAGGGLLSNILGGLPSFEGGGFTGMGARSGGIDGRGGQLAVLHPRETVVDHTRGGLGSGDTYNNVTINVSTPDVAGFAASQRQIMRQAKAAIG